MLNTQYYETYDGQKVADLVLRPTVKTEDLSTYFEITEGIKGKQAVYFLEPVEYIVKKDPGCGLGRSKQDGTISNEKWSPVDFKVWKYMCWTEIRDKVFEWLLKDGNDKINIEDNDYVDYMLILVKDGIFNDMVRIAWFGDTTMDTNKLTDPARLEDYNQYDGCFKQLTDAKAANKLTYVGMTFKKADGTVVNVNDPVANPGQQLPDNFSIALFEQMYDNQPEELDGLDEGNRLWVVSKDIYANYRRSMEKAYQNGIEAAYVMLQSGTKTLQYRGIAILNPKAWNKYLRKDFSKTVGGTKVIDLPHRAILTQKGNLRLGFDAQPATNSQDAKMKIFTDEMTETWNAKLLYTSDFRIPRKDLVVYAV